MNLKFINNPTALKVSVILLIQFVILCLLIQFDSTIVQKTLRSSKEIYVRTFPSSPSAGRDTIRSRISRRASDLREYCGSHKERVTAVEPQYERNALLQWVWMTSHRHRLFYCATPKCGSTTWKSYILEDLNITWTVDTHV